MTLGTRIVVMKDGVIQQVDTPQKLYESLRTSLLPDLSGIRR